jgi:hypothetical protein
LYYNAAQIATNDFHARPKLLIADLNLFPEFFGFRRSLVCLYPIVGLMVPENLFSKEF